MSITDPDENLNPVGKDVIGFSNRSVLLSGNPGTGTSRVQIEAIDQTTGSILSVGPQDIVARNIMLVESGNDTGVFTANGKVFGSTTVASTSVVGNILVGSTTSANQPVYTGDSITLGDITNGPGVTFKILEVTGSGKLGLIDGEHAKADSVEGYDIGYLIQRVFSVLKSTKLAEQIFQKLIKRQYSVEKLRVILAARAIGGFLDDKYALKAKISIMGPILASVVMLIGGVKVSYLTSWQGGVWYFENFFGDLSILVMLAITFLWLLGMTYTTKVLDGLDGLVGSLGLVASFIIFLVSLSWDVSGSTTSLLSLGLAGAILGFLVWNFYPAKIFLGESGSTFIGFSLGVLAILSGAKIATALLVMGLPALDVLWVIIRRLKNKQAFWQGDNQHHLHFRLLKLGLSQRQVVLLYSFLALLFGAVSIFFTTKAKLSALLILLCLMFILSYWLNYKTNAQQN
ncbi:MAG: UDP-N-acetylmuramyl pentapeptide phosphotransferase/UDP-N-acetylglucosamine-1-phosphate transferase [Parcubacteria group bacterium GW2011_GWA2_36_10]|nr:MAG: UDP-N-acetylmuramyl pentapeptide phosphotransferase/UDP-N-acetylglucosamine-1-phosphate transferase [Parcubacteria group bacterium GW2011_GWA2_36_10]